MQYTYEFVAGKTASEVSSMNTFRHQICIFTTLLRLSVHNSHFRTAVLSRCHGNTQLRLSQGHHVEDEVINSSVLTGGRHASDSSRYRPAHVICDVIHEPAHKWSDALSVSSQRGQDEQKKKRTSQFCYAGLPRYTALDAVGWVRHVWIDQSEDRNTRAHLIIKT